jgi:3'-5' exonuclease
MLAHLENCLTFKYIAVDTEGFLDQGRLGTSVAHPGLESMYFPEGHMEDVNIDEEVAEALKETISSVPYRIFHNAAHDLMWFPELFDLPFVCTMIMGHMVDENLLSKGLDYMHKHYCGGEGKEMDPLMSSIISSMGWYYVPYSLMSMYAGTDAAITMELFIELKPLYESQFGELWTP